MRAYGNTGSAVTCTNDVAFQGFRTISGRDIIGDLERARQPLVSPIILSVIPQPVRAIKERKPRPRKVIRQRPPRASRATPPRPEVTAAHERGLTVAQIAAELGLSEPTVRTSLKKTGHTPNRAPRTAETYLRPEHRQRARTMHQQILAGHTQGLDAYQTADLVGCSEVTVREHLKRDGLTAHPAKPRERISA